MVVREGEPYNAEPPPELLRASFITPKELFFSRNHAPVPEVNPASFELVVDGLVERPLCLSLDALHTQFGRAELVATLLCAGNRRTELFELGPIPGEVPWGNEAISTAHWAGVPLREVLAAAGVLPPAQHVAFLGLDQIAKADTTFGFGGSLPIAKALRPEVLLAYEMNGEALPPLHGFPLRVVAGGYIGARSVKWLAHIHVQAAPSDNYYQAHAYKLFPPEATPETADWEQAPMLGPINLNAVIMQPLPHETVRAGSVGVRGHATPAEGASITRVEVSPDGGGPWVAARLVGTATLELAAGEHELVARAYDSHGHTQPADPRTTWNFKGYMNNAWHRVRITVTSDE
jgi:sulfite oxidase